MDQERTMEEILREIREIYAREEEARKRECEPEPVARAFEPMREPKPWRR